MTVELSRNRRGGTARISERRDYPPYGGTHRRPYQEGRRERGGFGPEYGTGHGREYNGDGHPSLFIGLGPHGIHIPDHVIRQKLEDSVPILAFRRHGQCAFVDVQDDRAAERLIREVSNQYIDDARISVQFSRENRKRHRSPMLRGGYHHEEDDYGSGYHRRDNNDNAGRGSERGRAGRYNDDDRYYGRDEGEDYYRRPAPSSLPSLAGGSRSLSDRYYNTEEMSYPSRARR